MSQALIPGNRIRSALALVVGLSFAWSGLRAEDTPQPAGTTGVGGEPEAKPEYAAFPGIWFDYLPNFISAENAWEMKFRLGTAPRGPVEVTYLDGEHKALETVKLPVTELAKDRAEGRLQVFGLSVEAKPETRWIRLVVPISMGAAGTGGAATAGGAEKITVEIEIRDRTADCADLVLFALPAELKNGTAEQLARLAREHSSPAGSAPMHSHAWATLGARLAARGDGHPVVIQHLPRVAAEDRSGLVTGVFRPPASADGEAATQKTLVIAPGRLKTALTATLQWDRQIEMAVQLTGQAANAGVPDGTMNPPTSGTKMEARKVLVLAPEVEVGQPFHPFVGCVAAALQACDTQAFDRVVVILPWDDALLGSDPREFSVALDALAEHIRQKTKGGERPLTRLILVGPIRHPSVPEKRHTMLVKKVAERQQAQGFQWRELPLLNVPANWRLNAAGQDLAVYGENPNEAGLAILLNELKAQLK